MVNTPLYAPCRGCASVSPRFQRPTRHSSPAPARPAAGLRHTAAPCGALTSARPEPVMPRAGADRRRPRRGGSGSGARPARSSRWRAVGQERIPDQDGGLGPFGDEPAHEAAGGGILRLHLVGGVDEDEAAPRPEGREREAPSKPSRRWIAAPGTASVRESAACSAGWSSMRVSRSCGRSSARATSGEPG